MSFYITRKQVFQIKRRSLFIKDLLNGTLFRDISDETKVSLEDIYLNHGLHSLFWCMESSHFEKEGPFRNLAYRLAILTIKPKTYYRFNVEKASCLEEIKNIILKSRECSEGLITLDELKDFNSTVVDMYKNPKYHIMNYQIIAADICTSQEFVFSMYRLVWASVGALISQINKDDANFMIHSVVCSWFTHYKEN